MTKSQLIDAVARRLKTTKKFAGQAVDEVFKIITETIAKGNEKEKVQIIPFGSFSKRYRKAREGRDPRTGDKIQIRARTVPVFTPGKALKEAVDK
ncbi:MAG: HU family DNA-binding protein [Candidatus Eremiobacteraeota bacterium]|nr:HU family DNA-binding protein [Candidatus Eremiobacteraeota bacterium]